MNFEFSKETKSKISRNKKKLEKKLKVKIEVKDSQIKILGEEYDCYLAEKVFSALEKNFPISVSLLLIKQDYMLQDIEIKTLTKRKTSHVKSRIIGRGGQTLKTLSELSECFIQLNNNVISIIGTAEKIKAAINAVRSLILGSKQAKVYKYLETARKKFFPEDLGLKT